MKRILGRVLPMLAVPLLTAGLVGANAVSASAAFPAGGGSAPASSAKACQPTPPLLHCQPPALFTAPKTTASGHTVHPTGAVSPQLSCRTLKSLFCQLNSGSNATPSSPQQPGSGKNALRLIVNGVICEEGQDGRTEQENGQTWVCTYHPEVGEYVWVPA